MDSLRILRGKLSQTEAAERCGISDYSLWSRFETGDRGPRLDLLDKIAKAFSVPIGELLAEKLPEARGARDANDVIAKLKQLREQRGLSIERLAKLARLAPTLTRDIESRIASPSHHQLVTLFGVLTSELEPEVEPEPLPVVEPEAVEDSHAAAPKPKKQPHHVPDPGRHAVANIKLAIGELKDAYELFERKPEHLSPLQAGSLDRECWAKVKLASRLLAAHLAGEVS